MNQELIETVRRERAQAIERTPDLRRARHQLLEARNEAEQLVGFSCSCKLWGLNLPLGDEVARAVATADILERHREHVEHSVNTQVEFGYGVRCTPFRITCSSGSIATGMLCGPARGRKRCQFCKRSWSVAQCDFPLEGSCKKCKGEGVRDGYNCETCAGTGRAMCNKHVCGECRAHKEPDEDYCPDHRVLAGLPPLVKKEPCEWTTAPMVVNRKCLRESCSVIVSAEDRVLYFPRRSRAMCASCAETYLEIAK